MLPGNKGRKKKNFQGQYMKNQIIPTCSKQWEDDSDYINPDLETKERYSHKTTLGQ